MNATAQQTRDEMLATLRSLRAGDRVEVVFAPRSSSSPDERRVLTVTTDGRGGGSGYRVYTTSGRVVPGNFSGGSITDYGEWTKGQHGVVYQPTMQQAIRDVRSLRRVAVAVSE